MIRSLNQQGVVEEAVGYVAEAVDKGAQKVVVVVVDAEGRIEGHGFGDVTYPDLCYLGSFLQKRSLEPIDEVVVSP